MKRMAATVIVASALCVATIATHEGFRGQAYEDVVGVPTIGFGSTRLEGRPVRVGDRVTPVRAVVQLSRDAHEIWRQAAACIGDVPLYQHEADAFASLAYNIGPGAFCRSTLVKRLKQTPPDYEGACREILRWTKAGGRELAGLVRRRQAEYRLCMGMEP